MNLSKGIGDMTLKHKIWLMLGGLMALLLGIDAAHDYRAAREASQAELRRDANELRAVLMATRRVYHKQFVDSGVPLNDHTLGFLPAHALSRISAEYPNWTLSGTRFNNVSDRPRNPANRADASELAAMAWFRAHPKELEHNTLIQERDGREYFHFTAPIWTETYCLRCHESPQAAPPAIRARYDDGYGYRRGDLRGVMSIKIPAEYGRELALRKWRDHLFGSVLILLALFASLGLILNRLVTRRILAVQDVSRKLAGGDYGARLDTPGGDEIAALGRDFNTMADTLEQRNQALRNSEARYRALFEHMQTGFALHGIIRDERENAVDYRFLLANPAFLRLVGREKEDLIGRRVTQAMPGIEKDGTDWIGTYGRVVDTGTPVNFETYSQLLDKWFAVVAYSPEAELFAVLVDDISERKRVADALASSEEKYRILADYSSNWEYWLGADGRYVYVSPACASVCGHTPEDFLADADLMGRLLHPDDLPAWLAHLRDQNGPAPAGNCAHQRMQLRIRNKGGEYHWIEHVCVPVFNAAGHHLGRRGVNLDITERKRAEELERFAAFQAGIAEMSTSVLHNIGNAITAVTQDAEIIDHAGGQVQKVANLLDTNAERSRMELAGGADGATLAQHQCAIQSEAARALRRLSEEDLSQRSRRLGESVRHIADIVRIQQSVSLPSTQSSTFSLSQAIRSAIEMQGNAIARNDILVEIHVDPAVEQIRLSHNRLLQGLVNVIKNGIEAIQERGQAACFQGRLSIRADALGEDRLRLVVRDNGAGFEAAIRDSLFQFGFSSKQRGTGFGLHSVAVFAQECGGLVSLDSPGPGQGATLTLELPRACNKNEKNIGGHHSLQDTPHDMPNISAT